MKLYELVNDFEQMFDGYDDYMEAAEAGGIPLEDAQEAWFTTLDCMEEDIEKKIEQTALYIKNIEAESDAIKAERDKLSLRKQRKDNLAKRLREYIISSMDKVDRVKIETPQLAISVRNNAESVNVVNEEKFIKWAGDNDTSYLRFKAPEISKTAIKKALQSGQEVPYCSLERTKSLLIK